MSASKCGEKFYQETEFLRTLKDALKQCERVSGKKGFFNGIKLILLGTLYIMVYGERSNGKTFFALLCAMVRYFLYGEPFVIVRRWDEDFRPKSTGRLFGGLQKMRLIQYLSGGEWSHVVCRSKMFYLAKYEENGEETILREPIAYGFSLTAMEHDKGGTYPPNCTTVIFDEFLTRGMYLPDEMALFTNVLSTVLRDDGQAKIWMLGNTVSQYCPYFREMGLKHIKEMEKGDTQTYTGTQAECTIAVHWADSPPNGKQTDKYFAFDNPKLKMITEGRFETAVYPHCPCEIAARDIAFTFFIDFDANLLKCDVCVIGDSEFIFIAPKTTELKYPDSELIFTDKMDIRPNWKRRLTRPETPAEKAIRNMFIQERVYYADNECGEVVRVYLQWCETEKVV